MKYTEKTFTVPLQGDAYAEGWERIFGKKVERCHHCGLDLNEPAPETSRAAAPESDPLLLINSNQPGVGIMHLVCSIHRLRVTSGGQS